MQVTRAVLEMWSDNKTEWWWASRWGSISVMFGREGYVGQVELFPDLISAEGGDYVLAVQNSNDNGGSPGSNPHGTAYQFCITWAAGPRRIYLPLIFKKQP